MNEDTRLIGLKSDLTALQTQVSNQYTQIREISGILGTISTTLLSGQQISAHEREALLSRLDSIDTEIDTERREVSAILMRLERAIEGLVRDLNEVSRDSEEAVDNLEAISSKLDGLHPHVHETLRHARKLADRDPETGAEVSKSDKALKGLSRAFWTAVSTAIVLWLLSQIVPWIKGVHVDPPTTTIQPSH